MMKLNKLYFKCILQSLLDLIECHHIFFQKYWETVGVDICLAVRTFLETRELLQESNFTYITLIPKVKNPQDPTQLRPIALCNVV